MGTRSRMTPQEHEDEASAAPCAGDNEALWMLSPRGRFAVRAAPCPAAGPGEVVLRARAIAVNPVDAIRGPMRRVVTPWVRYPAVIGSDVAGEVVAIGTGVESVRVGQRVLGHAAGQEKFRNSAAEGAFQRYVRVLERVCTPLPDEISFERGAVLPLGLSTAAAGLYEPDQLALPLPSSPPAAPRDDMVLVWGASTSVGINAVQLARASGFRVFATAGQRNHEFVRSHGAEMVFDYRDPQVDNAIVAALGDAELAATVAIGKGSLTHALRIARESRGAKRIASVYPDPLTRLRAQLARRHGLRVSCIWGGTPTHTAVGPAIYRDFLPAALQQRRFRPAPSPFVAGHGLGEIPAALDLLRAGVSASKIVVTVD